jgi:hypothetical protein
MVVSQGCHVGVRKAYLVGILALEIIYVASINHVAGVDKELSSPHSLEEIPRSLHLCHEFDEELSTSIRIDTLHQTVDSTYDAAGVWESTVVYDRWVDSIHRSDGSHISC